MFSVAEAIENLALDDIDIYTKVSRRLIKEDVFSIVDTYIMPYSVECDRYSILGVITGVRIVENILHERGTLCDESGSK